MYRCVLVGLLLLLPRVCHGETEESKPDKLLWGTSIFYLFFFFSWTVLFDTTEGSLFHQLEVRNDRVHEVWWLVAGVGKHLVPSLFYAELGGSLGVRFIGHAPLWYLGHSRHVVTEISRVFVQGDTCTPLFFIPFKEEKMNFEAEGPHGPRCPLSPPSLLHSPYLLPLFARQPSCSALMRGHPKLLGWRKGGPGLTHFSKCHQRGHCTRDVGWSSFCFLCIFFFFQCDFPGSGWVEFTF